jgi:phosphoglycerate-specific signal transduction histidine kinase
MLIPWSNEFLRGTLWAVSHSADEAFSFEDYELLSSLADFASIVIRHQHHQELLTESEKARAAGEMAHKLAHRINNPLQSLTNLIFLARKGIGNNEELLIQAEADLDRLSRQVATLLKTSVNFDK